MTFADPFACGPRPDPLSQTGFSMASTCRAGISYGIQTDLETTVFFFLLEASASGVARDGGGGGGGGGATSVPKLFQHAKPETESEKLEAEEASADLRPRQIALHKSARVTPRPRPPPPHQFDPPGIFSRKCRVGDADDLSATGSPASTDFGPIGPGIENH
ncbi:hypothetical protein EAI_16310 [Harpegnathos saltator]|uniref:Uncharacterized protein n=1 Tax=Harpegnathos saltator TaxID=610380 RepID=E2BX16_HARSA|nr:hypothetical protein EAI_16310 [Harpegnathos saltator]